MSKPELQTNQSDERGREWDVGKEEAFGDNRERKGSEGSKNFV